MKFGIGHSFGHGMNYAENGENRSRFRYSSHIYFSPDFIFMVHQSRNIHPIAMKFGMCNMFCHRSYSVKFGKNLFKFRYSSHIYVPPDFIYLNHQSRNIDWITLKFSTRDWLWSTFALVKFRENRFRLRYSSHIYVPPDFNIMAHRSRNKYRIASKFGMGYSI